MTLGLVPAPVRTGERVVAGGCTLVRLDSFSDHRGSLSVAQASLGLPFVAQRSFIVYDVPLGAARGGHAHRLQDELLVAGCGSVTVDVDDGHEHATFLLDHPSLALHIPPKVWAAQRDFTPGACLLVLASGAYDASDHIDGPRGGAATAP